MSALGLRIFENLDGKDNIQEMDENRKEMIAG